VYAGQDPVSKLRHDLIEIIPPGPGADKEARRVRDRLISQVEERRSPRTKATVDQLLERYLAQFDGAASTFDALPGLCAATTSRHFSALRSAHWTRTHSMRSTRSCADAGITALRARSFNTAPLVSMNVMTVALHTVAGR
jgi:hypothetical protein